VPSFAWSLLESAGLTDVHPPAGEGKPGDRVGFQSQVVGA